MQLKYKNGSFRSRSLICSVIVFCEGDEKNSFMEQFQVLLKSNETDEGGDGMNTK